MFEKHMRHFIDFAIGNEDCVRMKFSTIYEVYETDGGGMGAHVKTIGVCTSKNKAKSKIKNKPFYAFRERTGIMIDGQIFFVDPIGYEPNYLKTSDDFKRENALAKLTSEERVLLGIEEVSIQKATTPKDTKEWPVQGMTIGIKGKPGTFKVKAARWDGGGTGHGPGDVYPNGWYVECVDVKNSSKTFHFYRRDTGCFIESATIDPKDIFEV